MTSVLDEDGTEWLDDLLEQCAEPLPADGGFSKTVMARIVSGARPATAAQPAACIPPNLALSRLPAVQQRDRLRQSWTTAGVLAAAAIGILIACLRPDVTSNTALVLTSIGLLWLLARDPRF